MPSPLLVNGELILHGAIGQDWFGDGITASGIAQALAEAGRSTDITVRINSGGGIATEGAAIYSALRNHQGDVNVVVEGIAASAASIVAMAGDTVTMSKGSVMMIHDPSGVTMGTAADHQKSIDALNAIGESMASVYAEKTGRTPKQERQSMTNETWMTADEAVAQGYADKVDGDSAAQPTAYNYAIYARAPQHLVAMAKAHGWTKFGGFANPQPRGAAEAALPNGRKENPMTEKTAAELKAAAEKDAADTLAAENAAKAQADAIKAAADNATKRAADIAALCKLAGQSEKTADFIAGDKSLDAIRDELLTAKAEADKSGNVDPRHKAEVGKVPEVDPKAWAKITDRLNARFAA
jgi:ATP-dependent Clp protease protease subunit